jgi:hypothetical protein
MIEAKTILLTYSDNSESREARSYLHADEVIRKIAAPLALGQRMQIRMLVVFHDLFVWTSSVSVDRDGGTGENFVQRVIRADWEFNAGVRPTWWPHNPEADRMWGVHYREDRDNGRAELARMRLERYDLRPLVLTALPPRPDLPHDAPAAVKADRITASEHAVEAVKSVA